MPSDAGGLPNEEPRRGPAEVRGEALPWADAPPAPRGNDDDPWGRHPARVPRWDSEELGQQLRCCPGGRPARAEDPELSRPAFRQARSLRGPACWPED